MTEASDPLAGVRRRPEEDGDLPFLLTLYRSTREQELSFVDWNDAQKQDFVAMQFEAQRDHYRREYTDASFEIVERHAVPIGRLYLHQRRDEIRVMDITLAPEARNLGLGGALLREVLADAAGTGRSVTIHVERFNPARRLYERLGFRQVGGEPADSIYLLFEARP